MGGSLLSGVRSLVGGQEGPYGDRGTLFCRGVPPHWGDRRDPGVLGGGSYFQGALPELGGREGTYGDRGTLLWGGSPPQWRHPGVLGWVGGVTVKGTTGTPGDTPKMSCPPCLCHSWWHRNEPNGGQQENCGAMGGDGEWFDYPCGGHLPWVCEGPP